MYSAPAPHLGDAAAPRLVKALSGLSVCVIERKDLHLP